MRKGLSAALALVFCVMLTACNMVSVNKEKDEAQIVAVVDGTEIPKGEFYDTLDSVLSMYGMSRSDIAGSETETEFLNNILDELVNQEALYQQAKEDGLVDESEEHINEVKEEIQKTLDEQLQSYKESAGSDEEAQELYDEYVTSNGYDDLDAKALEQIRQEGINAEYEKVTEPVEASEEDAREYFDEQVEAQKEAIDADPSAYSQYTSSGENFYNPAGSVYVKNLLISLPDDVQSEISSLRSDGDDAAADALRDEELAKIQAQAQAALDRANAGEDFDALIEELGSDPGMEQEPYKTYGYMAYEGSNFVQEFEDAALALTRDGQISGLVATDFGYHILEREAEADGEVPFDTVKDSIIESLTSTKRSDAYTAFLEELTDGKDVTLYTDRLVLYS
ncbi:MAG: hypothetical protein HDQ87_07000 [Clostridia bacterium]|nr:hypothetical protein [Clostridia bacterium]